MNEQKERLERELRFLKESHDAGVITAEEFDKGRHRVEAKLKELPDDVEEKVKEIEEIQEKPEEMPKKEWTNKKTDEDEFVHVNVKALGIIGVLLLLIIGFVVIRPFSNNPEVGMPVVVDDVGVLCQSDDDCIKDGGAGVCQNPGTSDAVCIYNEPVDVKLSILVDDECPSCDTQRMLGVLRKLFPGLEAEQLNYQDFEGFDRLDINVLPAYIFDKRLNATENFESFSQALEKKGDLYVVRPSATGSDYFYNRAEATGELKAFVLSSDAKELDSNMADVLKLFQDKISYEKIIVDKDDQLMKELAITTFPSFLVNNKIKFSGVRSPEIIKEKFCELNDLMECKTSLSTNLIKD